MSESDELPANKRLAHIGRTPTPPTAPFRHWGRAAQADSRSRLRDAVEAAIDMPGNVRANVGALLIGMAVKRYVNAALGKRCMRAITMWRASRRGRGTERWDDGDVYEGEFKAGMMDGGGTMRL